MIIDVQTVTGATEFGTQQQTLTILDNETTPQVIITTNTGNLNEANGVVTVTVSTSGSVIAT